MLEAGIKEIPDSYILFNNKVSDILNIGLDMLIGELNYRIENYDISFKHLKISVEKYDSLPYVFLFNLFLFFFIEIIVYLIILC